MSEEFEREIKCPYCKYKFSDSWEHNDDDGTESNIDCGECGQDFTLLINIEVTYSTFKKICTGDHSFGDPFKMDKTQEVCDRYNSEKFLNKHWEPHTTWSRDCIKCDKVEYEKVDLGGACPWG